MISRRFILATGSAAAVVGGAFVWARGPGMAPAREPWRRAGDSFGDPRLDALAFAILAPNPHNRQPWRFELVGDDRIDITCDLDRRLPETDPFDRQIVIGFGCMTELLRMAAAEKGNKAEITSFPDGDPQPRLDGRRIASVVFHASEAAPDPLFATALLRRTNRAPFEAGRPVDPSALANAIADAGGDGVYSTTDQSKLSTLIEIATRGWEIEYGTDATRRESIDLIRIGNRATANTPDGIALDGALMEAMKTGGVITADTLDDPSTTGYRQALSQYNDAIRSAQGCVWIKTPENVRETQFEAGRNWLRLNLALNRAGVSVHPLSQALQEFPEMAGPYRDIHDALGASGGETIQMFARVGHAKAPPPSPRWPLSSRLVEAA